jgi:hypothetical protein
MKMSSLNFVTTQNPPKFDLGDYTQQLGFSRYTKTLLNQKDLNIVLSDNYNPARVSEIIEVSDSLKLLRNVPDADSNDGLNTLRELKVLVEDSKRTGIEVNRDFLDEMIGEIQEELTNLRSFYFILKDLAVYQKSEEWLEHPLLEYFFKNIIDTEDQHLHNVCYDDIIMAITDEDNAEYLFNNVGDRDYTHQRVLKKILLKYIRNMKLQNIALTVLSGDSSMRKTFVKYANTVYRPLDTVIQNSPHVGLDFLSYGRLAEVMGVDANNHLVLLNNVDLFRNNANSLVTGTTGKEENQLIGILGQYLTE